MKKDKSYFKIGLFVIASGAALIAGLLFISADTLGGDKILVETYIDESVQGLNIGSEVLHRGVMIGQVKKITFAPLEYPMQPGSSEFTTYSRYVVVIMAIDPKQFPGMAHDPAAIETMIRNQIKLGLRCKLSYQGITGIAFMEADYLDPVRNPVLPVPWVPHNLYVPSAPSLMTSFTHAMENVFVRVEQIDIEGVLERMKATLDTMDQAIQDAKIGQVRESFVALTNEVRQSNEQLGTLLTKAQTIPDDFNAVVMQLNATMQQVETLLAQHEPNIDAILADLQTLLQNFRDLSESLKQDPAQILLSSPPKRSEVVQ